MKTYFSNVTNIEDLRDQYKKLLKKYHPDNGGNGEDIKYINVEYDRLFKKLKDIHRANSTEEPESNKHDPFDEKMDKAIRAMLQRIINLDVRIELIGSWVWCFDSYGAHDQLKALGFMYSASKKAWYWHDGDMTKTRRRGWDMAKIRNKYGSIEVETTHDKKLAS